MPVKVTLMYNLTSGGAKRPCSTESYLYLPGSSDLNDPALHTACEGFINARTELMGNNVSTIGYRVSIPGMRARSVRRLANTDLGMNINPGAQQSQGSSDPGTSCLQCEGFSANLQRSNKYLAGLPDAFITTAPPGGPQFSAPGLTNYQAAWNSWKALLIGGSWGFKARADLPADQPFNILDWSQQADSPFECIITVTAQEGIWVAGNVVHIRSVLMQQDWQPRPIGQFRIRSMSTDGQTVSYVLRDSSDFDATAVEQPGTIEEVTFETVAYNTFEPANQTKHARGPGPVLPVGRKKVRQRRKVS